MKLFRRLLILTHRYLGILLSLLVVMWFGTGIVMMYAGGMPRLTPELRLERLPGLNLAGLRLSPSAAADRVGLRETEARVVLLSVMDRPAYRFGGGRATTVFADTGEVLEELTLAQSQTIVSRFLNVPQDRIHHAGTLTQVDQWTLGQGRQMPLHKFRVADGNGTEVYVSPRTGELAMLTTRRSRALAWIGTIPHWLYFGALRVNQPVWYRIVVWTSTLACVLAVLGLILGVTQYRRQKPRSIAASIPYSGWLRWHYITGVVFGVFTLTWSFSGLLSMEPYAWTNATGLEVPRETFTGGPVDLSRFSAMDPTAWDRLVDRRAIKEVEFVRIHDEHYYAVRLGAEGPAARGRRERLHEPYDVEIGRRDPSRLLVSAGTLDVRREPFSIESIVARLESAVPDVPIADQQLLSEYDSYYYSRRGQTPLPVLRVRFDDPAQTWFYIDPETSQVVAQVHRLNRVERWLYNGLHSLDFAFWYSSPAWDVGMIALCLGGLASSGIGLLLGIWRVRRSVSRAAHSWGAAPAIGEVRSSMSESPR